jgi:hypothetical protein
MDDMSSTTAFKGRPIIRGIASTARMSDNGNVFCPDGIEFAEAVPLLLEHCDDDLIGIAFPKRTEHGVEFEARLFSHRPGINDQVADAWRDLTSSQRRGVSIGFDPQDKEAMPTGGIKHKRVHLLEISLCRTQANPDCRVTAVEFQP